MTEKSELFEWATPLVDVPEGLHLVAGLTGFADAGSAVAQLGSYLVDTLDHTVVARFDADALLDYRARRPIVDFSEDHLSGYRPPELTLRLAHDELHRPFLLLTGFEPDFRWEAFSAAVLSLIEQFQVTGTVWVHAIPMPVPHTRSIGVTVSGNRHDLVEALSVWRPTTQAPANALHLVEYRLQQSSKSTVGFVLLVPHYLADTEYPAAAITALESISAATGLIFPTDELRQQDRTFVANIDEQVSNNAELGRLVTALEERYDTYMQETPLPTPFADESGELPTADEIAAELEKFLANRRNRDGDGHA